MTKEQIEACEKLAEIAGLKLHPKVWEDCGDSGIQSEINYSRRVHYKEAFIAGFQAAQQPDMLLLNPIVKGLVSIVEKEVKMMSQLREDSGVYIGGISLAEKALAPFGKSDD